MEIYLIELLKKAHRTLTMSRFHIQLLTNSKSISLKVLRMLPHRILCWMVVVSLVIWNRCYLCSWKTPDILGLEINNMSFTIRTIFSPLIDLVRKKKTLWQMESAWAATQYSNRVKWYAIGKLKYLTLIISYYDSEFCGGPVCKICIVK